MSGSGAPLRWLTAILVGWIAFRVLLLADITGGGREHSVPRAPVAHVMASLFAAAEGKAMPVAPSLFFIKRGDQPVSTPRRLIRDRPRSPIDAPPTFDIQTAKGPEKSTIVRHAVPIAPGLTPLSPAPNRWSGSAWLLVRGNGATGTLASGGQLGGSQAGARITYRLGETPFAMAARISRPLQEAGAEAAIGIDIIPRQGVPVRIAVERRIALDDHARDAWAASIVGGFWKGHLPGDLTADGYGQAGVVGLHRRDLFADGAVRVFRPKPLTSDVTLDIGAGLWGGAQPGAARLDVGPHLGLRFPVEHAHVGLSLDGRFRIAGQARPGSGVTLTLGTDF